MCYLWSLFVHVRCTACCRCGFWLDSDILLWRRQASYSHTLQSIFWIQISETPSSNFQSIQAPAPQKPTKTHSLRNVQTFGSCWNCSWSASELQRETLECSSTMQDLNHLITCDSRQYTRSQQAWNKTKTLTNEITGAPAREGCSVQHTLLCVGKLKDSISKRRELCQSGMFIARSSSLFPCGNFSNAPCAGLLDF